MGGGDETRRAAYLQERQRLLPDDPPLTARENKLVAELARRHVELVRLRQDFQDVYADWRRLLDLVVLHRRVRLAEAIAGVPELGLPPTPRRTLYRWVKQPDVAAVLGVKSLDRPSTMQLLVAGLLAMHARSQRARGAKNLSGNFRHGGQRPVTSPPAPRKGRA